MSPLLRNFTFCVQTPTVSSGVNASLIVHSSHPGGRRRSTSSNSSEINVQLILFFIKFRGKNNTLPGTHSRVMVLMLVDVPVISEPPVYGSKWGRLVWCTKAEIRSGLIHFLSIYDMFDVMARFQRHKIAIFISISKEPNEIWKACLGAREMNRGHSVWC